MFTRLSPSATMRFYLLARGYIVVCGLFGVFAIYAGQVMTPTLYYDEGPVPPWTDRSLDIARNFGYALLLLLPYRWSMRGWFYRVRLALLIVASPWLAYAIATELYWLLQGRKHWLIIPASISILALAILAPSALVFRRRWVEAQQAH